VARDIQLSLLADARENAGWLPRWPLASADTNVMTGDPGPPFLADGWSKGLLAGHEEEAFGVLWRNATQVPPASVGTNGRLGNPSYLRAGYVAQDPSQPHKGGDNDVHHGASATLEYALSDCATGLMAEGLGHRRKAATLRRRAQNYRTIWDAGHQEFRARLPSGRWAPLTDDAGGGFHEGGPAQYRWLVPQDMAGLVGLLGGGHAAAGLLDAFFAGGDVRRWSIGPYAYYGSQTYNPNNEPDLHVPWAYAWTDQPWKTSAIVRAAQGLFSPEPEGLTGNDDLGTMSAWYVLSALGLYPVTSAGATYVLNAPLFRHATVRAGDRTLTIDAPAASDANRYIQGVAVGGVPSTRTWVSHAELLRAGALRFDLGSAAGAAWGTGAGDAPPSPCGG
jgi:predicted alpha-1,2-mannosidase